MSPSYCHNCGRPLAEGNRFCPSCGASADAGIVGPASYGPSNCPNCGRTEVGNGLFCIGCYQLLTAPPGVHVAGLGRRVAAYLLDAIIPTIATMLFLLLVFGSAILDSDDNGELEPAQEEAAASSNAEPDTSGGPSDGNETPTADAEGSEQDDSISFRSWYLLLLLPVLGYLVWWLVVLARGQTPGKQLMSIRVIRTDGRASGWGWTFLREFGVKGILVNAVSWLSAGVGLIVWIVDLLWAFWDKDRQTLHDKIMKTVVIDERAYRHAAYRQERSGF